MSLSKKNLGKLKTFIKENNPAKDNSGQDPQEIINSPQVYDPSKIFYSIIKNTENINETSKENLLLKKSEENFHKINFRRTRSSNNLSIEDELYDEFKYLLDE